MIPAVDLSGFFTIIGAVSIVGGAGLLGFGIMMIKAFRKKKR